MFDVKYTTSTQSTLLDSSNNLFNIPVNKMQMYSKLISGNATINENMDAYVQGVYMQDQYDVLT